jgi:hypothetical protein
MTNKLGEVINHGCNGRRAICIHHPPNSGDVSITLPDCFNDVPIGLIAYIDHEGKIQFTDGDPNE